MANLTEIARCKHEHKKAMFETVLTNGKQALVEKCMDCLRIILDTVA
jgi:hypothetical protein